MKLANFDFDCPFLLTPERVNVLVVEKPSQFFHYCSMLCRQVAGEDGAFVLSNGDKDLPLSKHTVVLCDFFSLQPNEKKANTKLHAALQQLVQENFLQEYQDLCCAFSSFFEKLNSESDCPLQYDGDDCLGALFKAFGVCFAEEDDFLQRLLLTMRIAVQFFKTKCFFLVNIKTLLEESQLKLLYHEAQLNEFCLFLLENTQRTKLEGEYVTIIDTDLCEIVA